MNEALNEVFKQRGLPSTRHHIFLCCDQTTPNCCTKEQGLESWDYLKKCLNELKKARIADIGQLPAYLHHSGAPHRRKAGRGIRLCPPPADK